MNGTNRTAMVTLTPKANAAHLPPFGATTSEANEPATTAKTTYERTEVNLKYRRATCIRTTRQTIPKQ
jgi:hypothetical protein